MLPIINFYVYFLLTLCLDGLVYVGSHCRPATAEVEDARLAVSCDVLPKLLPPSCPAPIGIPLPSPQVRKQCHVVSRIDEIDFITNRHQHVLDIYIADLVDCLSKLLLNCSVDC